MRVSFPNIFHQVCNDNGFSIFFLRLPIQLLVKCPPWLIRAAYPTHGQLPPLDNYLINLPVIMYEWCGLHMKVGITEKVVFGSISWSWIYGKNLSYICSVIKCSSISESLHIVSQKRYIIKNQWVTFLRFVFHAAIM